MQHSALEPVSNLSEYGRSHLSDLWAALVRHRAAVVFLVGCIAALQGFGLASPYITRISIDRALPSGSRSLIGLVALAEVALCLHRAWILWLRAKASRLLDANTTLSLQSTLFARVLRQPFSSTIGRPPGEFLLAMSSGEHLIALFTSVGLVPVLDIVFAGSFLIALSVHVPGLAAVALLTAGAMIAATLWMASRYARLTQAELAATSSEESLLLELMAGFETVRSIGAERPRIARWLSVLLRRNTIGVNRAVLSTRIDLCAEGATQALLLTHMVWGINACVAGRMTVGLFVMTYQLCQSFIESAMRLVPFALQLSDLSAHVRRVRQFPPPPPRRSEPIAAHPGIELRDVWFRYSSDSPWVLKGYSINVAPGQHIALDGPSGSGKTTILRLIAGLLVPNSGRVLVGGVDATSASAAVAYVPQDTWLYEDSIAGNLDLLSGGAPRTRILDWCRHMDLVRRLGNPAMGLDMPLPAGGATLSGGQRQLVLLCACLASERPIVLLDEAFANLDSVTRSELEALKLFAEATVINVTHAERLEG